MRPAARLALLLSILCLAAGAALNDVARQDVPEVGNATAQTDVPVIENGGGVPVVEEGSGSAAGGAAAAGAAAGGAAAGGAVAGASDSASNGTSATTTTAPQAPDNSGLIKPVAPEAVGTAWALVAGGAGAEDGDFSDFDVLARAVSATGYAGVLSTRSWNGLTILAPDDAAFRRTLSELGYTGEQGVYDALVRVLTALYGNPIGALYDIVGNHIVGGGLSRAQLGNRSVTTYAERSLVIGADGVVEDLAANVSNARVALDDTGLTPDNAIVYRIDRVVLPFEVDVEKAKAAAPAPVNCFPAFARVALGSGGEMQMHALRVGMLLRTGSNEEPVSPVYAFTHRMSRGLYKFVSLRTERRALVVSGEHLVYDKYGKATRADSVRIGTLLRTAISMDGERVVAVRDVWAHGLYAPHTLHSDLIVDGFVVSSYTAVMPRASAHAALAPVRAMFLFGVRDPLGDLLHAGWQGWPKQPHMYMKHALRLAALVVSSLTTM